MHLVLILRTLGVLLITSSIGLFPPILVSLLYNDHEISHLSINLVLSLLLGLLLWWPLRRRQHVLRRRDGFVIVTMFWVVLGILSSIPFLFGHGLSFSDAVFESISAFTTTGATVIVGLDEMAPSILFFRQELQWLGGIGVIVSAVAILPMLGIGGMQLYRAETPGPMKDDKLTPRIMHTAQALLMIYSGLTVACAISFWLAGMSPFDAIAHSLSTVSTGGFSTHDTSLAYYNSPAIEAVACIFMLLGATNFSIHFLAWRNFNVTYYWRNAEVRTFFLVVVVLILSATIMLKSTQTYGDVLTAFRYSAFQVISVITSTGFATADFSAWPHALPALLIFSSFMGGCAGSTAGGMKVIRYIILARQGHREMIRLVHPKTIWPLKVEGRVIQEGVADAVWGFFAAYIGVFIVIMLLLMADGMDQLTAFGAAATCLNNLGPGLGEVSSNFIGVSDRAEWLLSAAMLMGRLEIFTVLVLLAPTFWRD
jgi:trk system potassium uptake protein TrkH